MSFFSLTPGVFDLLSYAKGDTKVDTGFSFYIRGDLHQMSIQKSFLSRYRVNIQQQGVYPAIKQIDVPKVLELIYENRVYGWWHYKDEYVALKICTKDEFDKALERQCEKNT
jgi:hypothetical protein